MYCRNYSLVLPVGFPSRALRDLGGRTAKAYEVLLEYVPYYVTCFGFRANQVRA